MAFNSAVFFPAFKRAGMLASVFIQPPLGTRRQIDAGYLTPDQFAMDGQAVTADASIEYESACAPDLVVGSTVEVCVENRRLFYVLRQPPRRVGDGFFSVADLETDEGARQ